MLFEPIAFSGLTLANRIVRSATYEKRATEDGAVTDRIIRLYGELARGGAGLLITGFTLVHPSGRTAPLMMCAHSDIYMDGLRRLANAVHDKGGIVALQLVHGGAQCSPLLLGGEPPLAPSAPERTGKASAPRAMTDTEIWSVVESFAEAAWRAQCAEFDAVQIHAAHGYLISGFLSPRTNRRDDFWGGDEPRRSHFAEEIIKAIKQTTGEQFPVLAKLNADDMIEGGITPPESARQAQRLQAAGLDAVEISGGVRESGTPTIRPDIKSPGEEAYFRSAGKLFKDSLNIPVIVTGGMRSREVMDDVLKRGEADMVGMSRPLLREPHLPALMRKGKAKASCISCNKCTRYARLPYIRCKQVKEVPG